MHSILGGEKMYCYTVINSFKCVLTELEMWSKDSMEHHTFILKFADCTNKRLDYDLINRIRESRENFKKLTEETNNLISEYDKTTGQYQYEKIIRPLRTLIQKFIKYDKNFLSILYDLQTIGKRDKVWQTLIQHIIDEQKYSFRLMKSFKKQLDNL